MRGGQYQQPSDSEVPQKQGQIVNRNLGGGFRPADWMFKFPKLILDEILVILSVKMAIR